MKRVIFIIILILFIERCKDKQIYFDKNNWNFHTDGEAMSPLRELMTKDLLLNHEIKGLTTKELIKN